MHVSPVRGTKFPLSSALFDHEYFTSCVQSAALSSARWQQDSGDFSAGECSTNSGPHGTVWLHNPNDADLRGLLPCDPESDHGTCLLSIGARSVPLMPGGRAKCKGTHAEAN